MSGGGSAPPVHGRRIFIKLSFRGAQRRGNPFPLCGEGAVRGGADVPVAVPKILALPYGGRLKF